eukprot:13881199-Alexandrium_andersonii.AAC.1
MLWQRQQSITTTSASFNLELRFAVQLGIELPRLPRESWRFVVRHRLRGGVRTAHTGTARLRSMLVDVPVLKAACGA